MEGHIKADTVSCDDSNVDARQSYHHRINCQFASGVTTYQLLHLGRTVRPF